ncbi:helix-turn-helix domain-containing protein [Cupriavidus sp. Marseille-Q8015]
MDLHPLFLQKHRRPSRGKGRLYGKVVQIYLARSGPVLLCAQQQGLPKAEIARQLGVSLRTLYYWIDSGQLDRGRDQAPVRYGPRPVVPRKLDRFSGIITARLAEYPRLSATRLFEEIRAAGYEGGYTQVSTPI